MNEPAQALPIVIEIAREAGAMLRREFHLEGGPRGHGSHADIDEPVERFIRERLLTAFPYRFLGEETGTGGDPASPSIWVVDPNDGTSDFLKGYRGSAVSIALVREGVPRLGVVYAFAYPNDDGDLIAWAEGMPLTRNGVEVPPLLATGSLTGKSPPAIVFVSAKGDRFPEANLACVQPAKFIVLPSIAYRLAVVAAGDGVMGVCLAGRGATKGPSDWDYAGGHALLRGAGGILVDEKGTEIAYDADGRSSTWGCFGGAPEVVRELVGRDWKSVLGPAPPPPSPPYCLVKPQRGRIAHDSGRLKRAQGCLLGQFAGDALGGLVEFRSVKDIRAENPGGVRELRDGGTFHNLAGQPTDDSELALMLARTLVHRGTYDRGAAIDAYAHWWPRAWDRGNTIRQALEATARCETTEKRLRQAENDANRNAGSNGSLMRISPLGIFCAGRPEKAVEWARLDSGLTHPSAMCNDACAVHVAAIAHAIETGCSARECFDFALETADRSKLAPIVKQTLEAARLGRPADYITHMGYVMLALHNAFFQLLNAPTLEEGIVDTVMQGGDTDTTAAICGSLLGAVHGIDAVPCRWRLAIQSCRTLKESGTAHPQPQEFWPVDVLELAEALLTTGAASRGG